MQTINYDELSNKYKRSGKISTEANRIANKLICELCIQLNGNLARFLDVDSSLDNHNAVRVWVQQHLNSSNQNNDKDYEYFKRKMSECMPIYS